MQPHIGMLLNNALTQKNINNYLPAHHCKTRHATPCIHIGEGALKANRSLAVEATCSNSLRHECMIDLANWAAKHTTQQAHEHTR